MCGGKKKKRKKMINNGTIIRSTAIAANVLVLWDARLCTKFILAGIL